jgi:hypothetical protein
MAAEVKAGIWLFDESWWPVDEEEALEAGEESPVIAVSVTYEPQHDPDGRDSQMNV